MAAHDVHVEQVGAGAAGYLWRRLRTALGEDPAAGEAVDHHAQESGQAVYAAIDGTEVLGLALLRLEEQSVELLGTVDRRDDVVEALVERARYDAAAAGVADLNTIEP